MTVSVKGPISGFGSIIVNGQRYETNGTEFRIDGRTATQSDLKVGQVVLIRAERNDDGDPVATEVEYEELVEGPVEAIAADGSSLTILSQTVFITEDTVFEELELADISVDDILEVSGTFDENGDMVASYIERSDNRDGEYEVHGVVEGLDTNAQTFNLKGLTVGYANAALEDFENGNELSDGDRVEVEGNSFLNDGTFVASKVEYEGDPFIGEDGDEAEVEGIVTSFTSITEFEVAGVPVTTTDDTTYERGRAEDIQLGTRLEVEGAFNADGVIVAQKVKFELEANVRLTSTVDAVDADAGTITVLGSTITTDASTRYRDKDEGGNQEFGLSDIVVGDYVQVRAFRLPSDGTLLAKRVERDNDDADDGAEARGFVDEVGDDNSLVISGVQVVTNDQTDYELGEQDASAAQFFARVRAGDQVRARGTETEDGELLAEKLTLGNPESADD